MSSIDVSIDLAGADLDLSDLAPPIAGAVVKLAQFWADKNDRAVAVEWQRTREEWLVDVRRASAEHVRRLATVEQNADLLATRVDELTADPSFARVRQNYGYEAAREATDERRRLLAYASACSVTLDLTIAQVARVERTMRELDPTDLWLLGKLADNEDPPKPAPSNDPNQKHYLEEWGRACNRRSESRMSWANEHQPSGHILMAAGCVAVRPLNVIGTVASQGLIVTLLGRWVLQVGDGYLRATETE